MADEKFEILDGFVSRSSSNVDGTLTSTQLVITGNVAVDTDTFIVNSTNDRVGINKVPASGYSLDVSGTARANTFSGNGALLTSLDIANIPDLAANFLSSRSADSYESGGILSIANSSTLQVTSGSIKLSDNQTLTFGNGGDAILDLDSSSGDFIFSANAINSHFITGFVPNRTGGNAIAIGNQAARTSQNNTSIAIGTSAGDSSQGGYSVAIGWNAANTSQGAHSVAVGREAGATAQGTQSVSLGYRAGYVNQGLYSVAMGRLAGEQAQENYAVAIGAQAGHDYQGSYAIALGARAGFLNQGDRGIDITTVYSTDTLTTQDHVRIATPETSFVYAGGANTGWQLSIPSSNNESTTNAALSIIRTASNGFYNFNPTMLRFQAEDGGSNGPNGTGDYGNTTFVQDVYNGMTIRNDGDPWNLFEGKVTIRAGDYSGNTQNDVAAYFSPSNYMPYHSGSNFGSLYVKGLEMDDSIRTYKLAANSIVLQSGSQYGMVDGNFRIHANTSVYAEMFCTGSVGFKIRGGGTSTKIGLQGNQIDNAVNILSPGGDYVASAMCSAYSNSYFEAYYSGDVRFRTTNNGAEIVKAGYGTESALTFSDEQSPSLPADIQFNSFGNGDYYPTNSGGLQYSAAGHYFADTSTVSYGVPGFWCLMNGDMSLGTSSGSSTPLTEFLFDVSTGNFHADGNITAYSTSTNSDIKMKENVATLTNALDKVSALRGVTFDWKEKYRGEQVSDVGVIAQEVEEVLPELVTQIELHVGVGADRDNPETIKVVDYGKLTAVLIEAVKDLKAQVDALQSGV